MQIIHETEYEETMKNTVEPYLSARRRELYVPGADYPFRNENKRITGKIHMLQYLSDAPKGVVVISHGFTESAAKYDEVAYYFLKEGYHVYIPEHCGHGRSYRLTADPFLVHIDTWRRYVRDFLKACRYIKKAHPDLPTGSFCTFHGRRHWRYCGSLGAGLVPQSNSFLPDDPASYRKWFRGLQPPESLWRSAFWEKMKNT